MNLTEKLLLAGLAVALLSLPACERHGGRHHPKMAGGCGGLPCGQGPGAGHHYGQMDREFQVYIYTDPDDPTKCHADIDVAALWTRTNKKNGKTVHQTVTWFSDDDHPYVVNFSRGTSGKGSPFHNSNPWFQVPADGSISSGDLNPNASGYYDFAIVPGTDPQGTICPVANDPGYHVNP